MATLSMGLGQAVGEGLFLRSVSIDGIAVDLGSDIRLSCIVAAVEGDAQSFRKTCCCQSYHSSMKIAGCIDMSGYMYGRRRREWLVGGWQCSFSLAASFLASQQCGVVSRRGPTCYHSRIQSCS